MLNLILTNSVTFNLQATGVTLMKNGRQFFAGCLLLWGKDESSEALLKF